MQIRISWDNEFDDLMYHLWSKYGRQLFTLDGIGDQMDLHKQAQNFFKSKGAMADLSVDANANVASRSVIDWNFEFPKPIQRYNSYFLLWKNMREMWGLEIANKAIEMQLTGDIYINDFVDIGRPYCFNYSTYDVALAGLSMSSRMRIAPPRSLASFIRQIEQFTVYAANSTLGATGFADFLIVAAIYAKRISTTGYDGSHIEVHDPEEYIQELLTSFIYTLNWEFRGNQSPFTNISVYDRAFLEKLCPDYSLDGEVADIDYVEMMQQIYIDCMNSELERTPLTFPVTTACFSTNDKGEIIDREFQDYIAEANLKFGFINYYMGKTSTLSSCCRLRSESDNEYFNSFGAGSTKIGSLGVVTINLPRWAKKRRTENKVALEDLTDMCCRINAAKRRIIKDRIDRGAMPLYDLGYMDLKKQYSTTGFNGLSEAVEIAGMDILTEKGQEFATLILKTINMVNDEWQKKTATPHNMEQVPAESSAVKLAEKDKLLGFNTKYNLYSNQFIPLTTPANMLDRLELQGKFDSLCSGGAICHINVGEQISSKERMMELMDYAANKGVVYWAVNYAIKRCLNKHVWIDGEVCPYCGGKVEEVTTRVVGFFTNVAHWNPTRREYDWPNRQFYGGNV